VPGDDRVGLDQDEGLTPLGPEAMQGDPQESIRCPEPDPSSLGPLQNTQLVAKGQDLKLQRGPCSDRGQQRDQHRSQDNMHGSGR
jgi:hypothetical protein